MELILFALRVYTYILIARAIVSWIPNMRYSPIVRTLDNLTEPVLRPLRRILPPEKTGYIDFTPLIAIFGIQFLMQILVQLMYRAPRPMGL